MQTVFVNNVVIHHETFREATLGVTVAAQGGTDFTRSSHYSTVLFLLISRNAMLGSLPRG